MVMLLAPADVDANNMNLRHMEVFRAVMLTGTITAAAELLHVSQPAVSKVLAQAERRSGLQLFERVRRRLVPTQEAQRLFAEIEDLWRGVERVRDVSRGLANPRSGTLRLAVSSSLAPYVTPRVVTELYKHYPGLKVQVDILIQHLLVAALVNNTADLGVAMLPSDHPNLVSVGRYRCALVCVMPTGHPLAQRKVVRPKDLAGHRVISSPETSTYGRVLRQAYGNAVGDLKINSEVRSGPHACWFAQAGAGIAVVDELAVMGGGFARLVVRPLRPSPRLEIRLLHSRDRPLSVPARDFCRIFAKMWGSLAV